MSSDTTTLSAGSSLSFIADGYSANAGVEVVLDWGSASPTTLGTATADEQGRVSANIAIPETTPPRLHSITAWGPNNDGHQIGPSLEFAVTEAQTAADEGRT
jgi:hypothetical protein